MIERHGFEPSAVRARIKARMAVVDLANGRPTVARASDDQAAWALRKLSRERPPDRPKAADLLAVLKAAMVAAHPDKGGDSDTFVAARRNTSKPDAPRGLPRRRRRRFPSCWPWSPMRIA